MGEIFARMAKRKPMVAVTDGLPRERLLKIGPDHYDPHVWFDVGSWSETLREVTKALIEFDPSNTLAYQIAANSHAAVLARLDGDVREQLSRIPASRRVLVTAHDAFHYFGRAYNLEVKAIQGVSTESEAGVREINDLVDFIVGRGIKAVFVESSVSNRNVEGAGRRCRRSGSPAGGGGRVVQRRDGPPRHARGNLRRHGTAQRRYDRRGAAMKENGECGIRNGEWGTRNGEFRIAPVRRLNSRFKNDATAAPHDSPLPATHIPHSPFHIPHFNS